VYDQVDGDPKTGYLAEADAGHYLASKHVTGPIEVLCYNRPYLRAQLGLEAASRFTEVVPLQIRRPDGSLTSYQKQWQQEFVDTIRMRHPAYIISADNGFRIYVPDSPLSAVRRIPGFAALMDSNYRLDTTIHGFTFYRRTSLLTR
jgi:hypothetical protein